MELVVVVALLAIVAGMACPLLGSAREEAEKTAAKATMSAIREAILGNATMPGYLADMKYAPGFQPSQLKMRDLLNPSHLSVTNFDRVTERGWRGPYLRNVQPVANTNDDEAAADPWGNPIVIQIPNDDFRHARLVSAGKNGKLDTLPNVLTISNREDDLVLFLNRSDEP